MPNFQELNRCTTRGFLIHFRFQRIILLGTQVMDSLHADLTESMIKGLGFGMITSLTTIPCIFSLLYALDILCTNILLNDNLCPVATHG
jgi:cytochrome c biogenesis protein CcdA